MVVQNGTLHFHCVTQELPAEPSWLSGCDQICETLGTLKGLAEKAKGEAGLRTLREEK